MTPELKNRILWAFIPASVILVTIFVVGPEATFLVATLGGLQAWREYSRMMGLRDRPAFHLLGYGFIVLMFSYAFFIAQVSLFWMWLIWVSGFFMLYLEKPLYAAFDGPKITSDAQKDWTALCRFVLGLLYTFMIFGFVGPIVSKRPTGEQLLILGLMVVFVGDTTSYFVGKKYGKRKLWPALSPGKTIEGALAGAVGSLVAGILNWALFKYLPHTRESLPLVTCLTIGLLAPPLAQSGDFLESLMKRAAGLKDSGSLLPGHGGLLDRTDGLAFVMPLIYFLYR